MKILSSNSTLDILMDGTEILKICNMTCGIINILVTLVESKNVICGQILLSFIDFLHLQFRHCDNLVSIFIHCSLVACKISALSDDDANVLIVGLMMQVILQHLATSIDPMNDIHVRMMGCRIAQLTLYSGKTNVKHDIVANAPAITNKTKPRG